MLMQMTNSPLSGMSLLCGKICGSASLREQGKEDFLPEMT